MITIEHNIPMPRKNRGNGLTETLQAMQIGDSILIDEGLRTSIYILAKRQGIKVCSRFAKDNKIRVWRTK